MGWDMIDETAIKWCHTHSVGHWMRHDETAQPGKESMWCKCLLSIGRYVYEIAWKSVQWNYFLFSMQWECHGSQGALSLTFWHILRHPIDYWSVSLTSYWSCSGMRQLCQNRCQWYESLTACWPWYDMCMRCPSTLFSTSTHSLFPIWSSS